MAALSSVSAFGQDAEYAVVDLGIESTGDDGIRAHGMNNKGQIVGELVNTSGANKAFIWLPEADYGLAAGMNLLDDAVNLSDPGVLGTVAFAINESGIAVGRMTEQIGGPMEDFTRPMIWDLVNGTSETLTLLDDQSEPIPGLVARGVNNDSPPIIVGGIELEPTTIYSDLPDAFTAKDGFVYDYGGTPELLVAPSGRAAQAFDVSDTASSVGRRLVGFEACAEDITCGVPQCHGEIDGAYWTDPTMNPGDIDPIGTGDARVVAWALNSDGFIAGLGSDPSNDCRIRGLFWTSPAAEPVVLPELGADDAEEANDLRDTLPGGDVDVVGRSVDANIALLWRGEDVTGQPVWSGPIELDDVAVSPSPFAFLGSAEAINNDGWITGWGRTPGLAEVHGYLVTPIGEYTSRICPGDLANDETEGFPDGVVDVFDLLYLLASWNQTDSHADISGSGDAPDGVVNVFDLIALLAGWGDCTLVPGANTVLSLEDEMLNAGLTMNDWNEFEDVMLYSTDEDEKENYRCWMQRLLSACAVCPPCPDTNPFR